MIEEHSVLMKLKLTKQIAVIILMACINFSAISVATGIDSNLYDGPYIFDKGDSLQIQWIDKGIPHDSTILKKEATEFIFDSLPYVNLRDLNFKIEKEATYDQVKKVVAISDIHGQYDILLKLLTNHKIIDGKGKWNYGNNHVVVIGDNFDRGPKVMDILWFFFQLQKEAEKSGGKLHMLLGNHEMMVLNGDLRYLNKKYYYTSAAFKTRYDQFFRKGSILGDWIANQQALVSINQRLFVHAGMSPSIVQRISSLREINDMFIENILRQDDSIILEDSIKTAFYSEDGPLWFRGYFDSDAISFGSVDTILQLLGQKNIIVGHTSQDQIESLYNDKVIVVDCSIKLGISGQLLFLENEHFTVGNLDGSIDELPVKKSLFDYIYQLEGIPKIEISTNVKRLVNRSIKEEYQEANLKLFDSHGNEIFAFNSQTRARGNMRKQVCRLPPLKIDIPKIQLQAAGLNSVDKLKVVLPCRDRNVDDKFNAREFFLYELYLLIDTNGIKARRVNFVLKEEDDEKYNFTGFLVEDEDEYAHRKNAIIVESGTIRDAGLEREPFLKMLFFQYMIANTDWTVSNKHNLELVKLPNLQRVVALPYDFDYSGFVGQSYAVPHETLPIKTVHDRYFFNYKITEEEYYEMVTFYLSIESEVYNLCDQATYMDEKTINQNKKYLGQFFSLLKNPEKLKYSIIK